MSNLKPVQVETMKGGEVMKPNVKILHTAIDRDLARAIGWQLEDIHIKHNGSVLLGKGKTRKVFDYRNKDILWSLCTAFDAFPFENASPTLKGWSSSSGKSVKVKTFTADTPELACAMAIIYASKHMA